MRVPVVIAQHNVWRAVRPMLIRSVIKMPQKWLQAQRVKVVPTGLLNPNLGWIALARIQPHFVGRKRHHAVKAAIAVAQIDVVRVRLVRRSLIGMLQLVKAVGMRYVQRPQQKRIQHAEHHRIGGDGQGQRQHRGRQKPRRLAQRPHAHAHILPQGLHEMPALRRVHLLLVLLAAAKLNPRPPLGLGPTHTLTLQVVGAVRDPPVVGKVRRQSRPPAGSSSPSLLQAASGPPR